MKNDFYVVEIKDSEKKSAYTREILEKLWRTDKLNAGDRHAALAMTNLGVFAL